MASTIYCNLRFAEKEISVSKNGDGLTDQDTVIIRVIPRPSDINHNGHIFGGWILSQMDIAGGVVAAHRAGGSVATVAIDRMKFVRPMLIGDWLSIYGEIAHIGVTSITVHLDCRVRRQGVEGELKVTEGTFVYVRIDPEGHPMPVEEVS
jgi:acyl-CoA thioesterase YciA